MDINLDVLPNCRAGAGIRCAREVDRGAAVREHQRKMRRTTLSFTIGIHDDILTQISKIRALKVISRTSVMEYGDTTKLT